MAAELVLEIKAEIDELKRTFNDLRKQIEGTSKFAGRKSPFRQWQHDLRRLKSAFLNLKTVIASALAAAGVGAFTKSVIDAAASAEQLRLRLQIVTGEGEKTFKTLLTWASKLPISTEKAVDMFITLQAMGLKPTLNQMTLLVDTALALGGSVDTVEGIGRALGQIAAKGKLSMEEVLQLAERGVPIFEILREELGLAGEQLSRLGELGISASEALEAIFRGLEKRFKGASKEFAGSWQGLMEQLSDLWYRFRLTVAESGPFQVLKKAVSDLIAFLNTETGKLKLNEWAAATGKAILAMTKASIGGFKNLLTVILLVKKALAGLRWFGEFLGVKAAEFAMKMRLLAETLPKIATSPGQAGQIWADFGREWDRLGKIAEEQITENTRKMLEGVEDLETAVTSLRDDTTKLLEELEKIEGSSAAEYFGAVGEPVRSRSGTSQIGISREAEAGELGKSFDSQQKWQRGIQDLIERRAELEEWLTERLASEVQRRLQQLEIEKDRGIETLLEAYGKGLIDFEELQRKMTEVEEVYSKRRQEILEAERRKKEELSAQARLTQIQLAERRGEISPVEALRLQLDIYRQLAETAQQRLSALSEESSAYYEQLQIFQQYQMQITELQMKLQELTGTFDQGFVAAIRRAGQEMASTFRMGQQLAQQLVGTISNTLSQAIYDAFTDRLKDAKDYLRSFAQSMLQFLSQLIAKLIIVKSLQAAGFMGGVTIGFASGGIVEGLKLIRAYQTGGIVDRPTLALIGEGRHKEAIVPLPDGRHIPAIVKDGSEPSEVVVVNVLDQSLMEEFLTSRRGRRVIRNIIRGED